jgi:hypothetical protein
MLRLIVGMAVGTIFGNDGGKDIDHGGEWYCDAAGHARGLFATAAKTKNRGGIVFPPAVLTASGSKGMTAAAILSARDPQAPPTLVWG